MNAESITKGISQRALDALWIERGGQIEHLRRTGERRYLDPMSGKRSDKYSARRKDASARLVTFVRQVMVAVHLITSP